jgi:predicted  nucleic acid-binding Zn-ribbon protein
MFGRSQISASPVQPGREVKDRPSTFKSTLEVSPLPPTLKHDRSTSQILSRHQSSFFRLEDFDSDVGDVRLNLRDSPHWNQSKPSTHIHSHDSLPSFTTKPSRYDVAPGQLHHASGSTRHISFPLPREQMDEDDMLMSYLGKQKQLRDELFKKEGKIMELQQQFDTQHVHNTSSLIEIADLRGQITNLKSEKQKLHGQISTLRSEVHDLRMEDTYKQDKIKGLNMLIGKGQQDLNSAQQNLSSVRKATITHQDKYNRLQSDYNQLKSELGSAINRTGSPSRNEQVLIANKVAPSSQDKAIGLTSDLNYSYKDSSNKQCFLDSEVKNLKTTIELQNIQISQQQSRLTAQHARIQRLLIEIEDSRMQLVSVTSNGASISIDLEDKYDKLHTAAKAVAHYGGFLAHGGFGEVGTAFGNLKDLLKD